MSDVTINSNKLLAMITGAVFAAGAAGAGLGAAVGIRAATPTAVATADSSAADRQALQQDRNAFKAEVKETLQAMRDAGGRGPTVEEISAGIQLAFSAMDKSARAKAKKDAEAGEAYLKSLSKGLPK